MPPHLRLVTRHALLTYASKHWPRWQLRTLASLVRNEARLRAFGARRRGDETAAMIFDELGMLTADLVRGDKSAAERRLLLVVHQEEESRAARFDRHSKP